MPLVFVAGTASAIIKPSSVEQKCAQKVGKFATKVARIAAKEIARCRDSDINGSSPGACPNAGNLDEITVEGGDTLNGLGDNTNYYRTSVWCFSKTVNDAVNTASGFGGPGVTRERGTNVLNADSIS